MTAAIQHAVALIPVRERPILFSAPMVRAILEGRKTQTRRLVDQRRLRVRLPKAVSSDLGNLIRAEPEGVTAQPGEHRAQLHEAGAVSIILHARGKRPEVHLGVKPGEFHFVCPYAQGETVLARHTVDDQRWTVQARDSSLWVRETHLIESNRGVESAEAYPPRFSDGRPTAVGDDEEWGRWWQQAHYRATDPKPDLADLDSADDSALLNWSPSIFMPRWASRITLEVVGVRLERLQQISEEDAMAEGVAFDGQWWRGGRHPVKDTSKCMPSAITAYASLWDDLNARRGAWASNPWVWAIEFRRVCP